MQSLNIQYVVKRYNMAKATPTKTGKQELKKKKSKTLEKSAKSDKAKKAKVHKDHSGDKEYEQLDTGIFVNKGKAKNQTFEKARLLFPELMGEQETEEDVQLAKTEVAQARLEYGDDFNIKALMSQAKDPLTGTLRDLKIDDRDLPMAKNYFEWCTKISGLRSLPWARQMWSSLHLFGDMCPRCSDREWFKDIMAIPKDFEVEGMPERLALLEYGRCVKCGIRKHELVKSGEIKVYDEFVAVWGQRSGKSRTAASNCGYIHHRFLKFPMFGTLTRDVDTTTPLTMSFVSLSFAKAYALLWEPFKTVINTSVWFQEHYKLLDYYGRRYGEELYTRNKESMSYAHKNLRLLPTHPAWDQLRGETRYAAVIDELGLFPTAPNSDSKLAEGEAELEEDEVDDLLEEDNKSKRLNADEAHKSLDNSLLTIRSAAEHLLMSRGIDAVPTGILQGVSSPTSEQDKVMRLLKESKTDIGKEHILGIQLPTWEVNPAISRNTTAIRNAYAKNPVKAERDFGANPPRLNNSFVSRDLILSVFKGQPVTHRLEHVYEGMWISGRLLKGTSVCNHATIMTIDAGYTNNSFTLNVHYFDHTLGKSVTPCVLEVIPTGKRKINFNSLYTSVILPLARDLNSVLLFADQWNSIDLLQRFSADVPNGKSKKVSPKRKHFDEVLQMMRDGSIVLPQPEMDLETMLDTNVEKYRSFFMHKPVAHLAFQMATVRDVGPGRCPEKAPGYTDDIFRSWILGPVLLQDPKVQAYLKKHKPAQTQIGSNTAVFIGRSGGRFLGLTNRRR